VEQYIEIITSFPCVVFTVALIFVSLFWMLAILGLVDIDIIGVDLDIDVDAETDPGAFGALSGFLTYFGLNGIPVTVVFSVLTLVAWLLSYFASAYIIAPLPYDWLRYLFGMLLIVGCGIIAAPITGMSLRPTKQFFTGEAAASKTAFAGSKGVITTLEVNEKFGQAMVDDGGAGLILDVRCDTPNTLTKGDEVALITYIMGADAYQVMAEEEFRKL